MEYKFAFLRKFVEIKLVKEIWPKRIGKQKNTLELQRKGAFFIKLFSLFAISSISVLRLVYDACSPRE